MRACMHACVCVRVCVLVCCVAVGRMAYMRERNTSSSLTYLGLPLEGMALLRLLLSLLLSQM